MRIRIGIRIGIRRRLRRTDDRLGASSPLADAVPLAVGVLPALRFLPAPAGGGQSTEQQKEVTVSHQLKCISKEKLSVLVPAGNCHFWMVLSRHARIRGGSSPVKETVSTDPEGWIRMANLIACPTSSF